MFVKVVQPYREEASAQVLYEATQVRFGTVITYLPVKDRDFSHQLGAGYSLIHLNGLIQEPGGHDEKGDWWIYRYAIWPGDDGNNVAVVTSGDLYILSNSGKTVERVVS